MMSRTLPGVSAGMVALFVTLAGAFGLLTEARGQVQVHISFHRTLYMIYEPIICTVSIRNLTGADLVLSDTPEHKWFGFQVETGDGRPLPPLDASYSNEPFQVAAGQTVRRSVNLTPLYPLSEFGAYRVRAAVYVPQFERYFASPTLNIELTDGRVLWEQTVGVPASSGVAGKTRKYSLLTHRLPASTMLYLRVEDKDRGVIYCTTQLGRFLSFGAPSVMLDAANQIHIIHNLAPKEFLYSHFNLDGKVQKQQAYQDWGSRPALAPTADGGVGVVGGTPYDPKATPPERQLPGLSERPIALPAPSPTPTPRKQDSRPENLLSR